MAIREMNWEDLRKMILANQGWDPGTEEESLARIAKPMVPSKQEEAFLSVLPVRKRPAKP